MSVATPEVLVDGLVFPEAPRWHDGRFWFSDMHGRRVCRLGHDGTVEEVVGLADMPSGLGFLPDGDLLIASMWEMALLRLHDGELTVHADLSSYPGETLNDMVVDPRGRAYVGARHKRDNADPTSLQGRDSPIRDCLVVVGPDGTHQVAADDLVAPNGTVLTADGGTLIVAETRASRLTAFTVDDDGSLHDRRVYADVEPLYPDGIALDEAGGVWFGSPITGAFARTLEGGEITHRIELDDGKWAVACTLGGPGRRTLYLVTARTELARLGHRHGTPGDGPASEGWIESIAVEVPGVGLP